jgi:hypothetical protein
MSVKLLRWRNTHWVKYSYKYCSHDPLLFLIYNKDKCSSSLTLTSAALKQKITKLPKQMGSVWFRYSEHRQFVEFYKHVNNSVYANTVSKFA